MFSSKPTLSATENRWERGAQKCPGTHKYFMQLNQMEKAKAVAFSNGSGRDFIPSEINRHTAQRSEPGDKGREQPRLWSPERKLPGWREYSVRTPQAKAPARLQVGLPLCLSGR